MKEIITVNGQQYNIETASPQPLTQEQRNEVIRKLGGNQESISTLATGCSNPVTVGTTKTFQCSASGGNGSYNYTLTIGTSVYNSPLGTGGTWNQSHTFNTVGTIAPVILRVVDTCTGTTLFNTDSCPLGITVVPACTQPICSFIIV